VKHLAKAKMDEQGRVQIPRTAIKKLGLKSGTEFDLKQDGGILVLKPIARKRRTIRSPPLFASEIAEIEEGEREIAAGTSQVYDNASDLLNALHVEREKAQAAKKKAK
jgi:bifunctional DNA-binding transcriptional regulator/antitoxin component of YhaV-PrlF toxin-antitoxin module